MSKQGSYLHGGSFPIIKKQKNHGTTTGLQQPEGMLIIEC